jgi:hypothetical protein
MDVCTYKLDGLGPSPFLTTGVPCAGYILSVAGEAHLNKQPASKWVAITVDIITRPCDKRRFSHSGSLCGRCVCTFAYFIQCVEKTMPKQSCSILWE